MKHLLFLLLLLPLTLSAQTPPSEYSDSTKQEMKKLVKQLMSEDTTGHYQIRQRLHQLMGLKKPKKFQLSLQDTFPEFKLATLRWGQITSNKLKGKPSLLYFWDFGRQPCLNTIPILNKLKTTYGDKVNFVAICDTEAMVLKQFFKDDLAFNFQHVNEGKTLIQTISSGYNRIIVLDKNLIIQHLPKKLSADDIDGTDATRLDKEIRGKLDTLLP